MANTWVRRNIEAQRSAGRKKNERGIRSAGEISDKLAAQHTATDTYHRQPAPDGVLRM